MKNKNLFYVFIAIGIISFALAYFQSPARAWNGYLMNYYYITCIALGGVFFAGTQHLTNAGWSATVRRIPESFTSWLPLAVLLLIPLLAGFKAIYQWTDPALVAKDHLLAMKTGYLNIPFFAARTLGFFALWYLIGGKLVKNSLKQDEVGGVELTQRNIRLSAIFMPLFAILFSTFSFDLIMSLDPHWYSTMFGVNCFANLFLSAMAVVIVIVVKMMRKGSFGDSVNENHLQNLGLLMFAFVIFYAYIAFCQFMLIWYANLPEETSYYLKRWEGGWSIVAMAVLFGKFIIPFLVLLPREAKRNPNRVIAMAYWLIAACWLDTFWMVMPNYSKSPFVPVFEIGIFLGFLGAFGLVVAGFLGRHPVQPLKDPRIPEALHLHQ